MSKHDYSQNTVAAISDAITNSKNEVDNAILSIESMTYSWDTEIIQNVVTWFEVQTILELKRQIGSMLEKADLKFDIIVQNIEKSDSVSSQKLESAVDTLSGITDKVSSLENYLLEYSQIGEIHRWMNEKEAAVYSIREYISYNKEANDYFISDENYKNLKLLFKKEELDYSILTKIVDAFINSEGEVNTEAVEKFIIASYEKDVMYPSENEIEDKFVNKIKNSLLKFLSDCPVESIYQYTDNKIAVDPHIQMHKFIEYYRKNGKSSILFDILKNSTKEYDLGYCNLYAIKFKNAAGKVIMEKDGRYYEIDDEFNFVEKFGNVKIEVQHGEDELFETTEDGNIGYYETKYIYGDETTTCKVYEKSNLSLKILENIQEKQTQNYSKAIEEKLNELIKEVPDSKELEKELGKDAAKKIIETIIEEISGASTAINMMDSCSIALEHYEKVWEIKLENGKVYSLGSTISNYINLMENTKIIEKYFKVCNVSCKISTIESSSDISWSYTDVTINEGKTLKLVNRYNKECKKEEYKIKIDELRNPDFESKKVKAFIDWCYTIGESE